MACEGYDHGTRVRVIRAKASTLLETLKTEQVTGVVVEVNYDKHRLRVRFAGDLLEDVAAHDLEENAEPNANNLRWVIARSNLNITDLAEAAETSSEMIFACMGQMASPNHREAIRLVLAINERARLDYTLQDVFPLEAEGEAELGASF